MTLKYLLFLLLLVFSQLVAAEKTFFDQHLGDFSEELSNARNENKTGILIFFSMDDCPFCLRMKTTVLNQPEVIEFYKKHFLIFPVDIEGSVELVDFQGHATLEKDFAFKQNRVRATPVFAFFDLNGNRVVRFTGPTSGVEEFMWLGQFVVDGAYKNTNFTRYKKDRRKKSE